MSLHIDIDIDKNIDNDHINAVKEYRENQIILLNNYFKEKEDQKINNSEKSIEEQELEKIKKYKINIIYFFLIFLLTSIALGVAIYIWTK